MIARSKPASVDGILRKVSTDLLRLSTVRSAITQACVQRWSGWTVSRLTVAMGPQEGKRETAGPKTGSMRNDVVRIVPNRLDRALRSAFANLLRASPGDHGHGQ